MATNAISHEYRMTDYLALPSAAGAAPFIFIKTGLQSDPVATAKGYALAMAATAEIEIVSVTMADILSLGIDDLIRARFLFEVDWGGSPFPTASQIVIGLASAQNDDPDAVAQVAWFRLNGTAVVKLETKDGTNSQLAFNTGVSLPKLTLVEGVIDIATEIQTVAPPGINKAGKGNVTFFLDNPVTGISQKVSGAALFDMSAYSGGLQLFAQVQKTSSTDVASLTIKKWGFEIKEAKRPPQPA